MRDKKAFAAAIYDIMKDKHILDYKPIYGEMWSEDGTWRPVVDSPEIDPMTLYAKVYDFAIEHQCDADFYACPDSKMAVTPVIKIRATRTRFMDQSIPYGWLCTEDKTDNTKSWTDRLRTIAANAITGFEEANGYDPASAKVLEYLNITEEEYEKIMGEKV